ncbi:nuclear transport factor 2 family protein [uncultured Brevundimonas sp.]|uniref:YybH family protein n=1 Tax=uncultured Brevundimonas sp. TaxID=213418 RepID=UPI002614FD5D|nr:nuclear transport factor 2 family protein [uncultured Brevundimonas sp.]
MIDRRVLLGAGAATASAALANAASAHTPYSGDGASEVLQAYRRLINRHDFDLLEQQVIAHDAVFVFSNLRHEGIAAIRSNFERTWSILPDEVYSMSDVVWLFSCDEHAACTLRYHYSGKTTEGRRMEGGGQGVLIFGRRQGQWRLMLEQLTPDTRRNSA